MVVGDSKRVMTSQLTGFLQSLEVVNRVVKDKKYNLVQDYFRQMIVAELETSGNVLVDILKEIILVRQRDRAVRENTVRAVKRLLKIGGKPVAALLYKLKIHIFVTFILEREYKSSAVAKERQQCFKLITAWLKVDADNFPLLFSQAIVSIVRNEEEFQLRHNSIDLMIDMCSKAPKVAA